MVEEETKMKRLVQEPEQSSALDAQKYEEMLAEYRQIKEQERKK